MRKTYQGACHCGFVRFEVTADIDHLRVCDCSVCHKRGALNFRVDARDMRMLTPLSELTRYTWGSHTGADYFCPTCGILPFRRPSAPTPRERAAGVQDFDGWAVNTRCLRGFDTTSVPHRPIAGSKI